MQKQAVEIKSDMLLAENRRIIDEKDVSLQLMSEDFYSFNSFNMSANFFFLNTADSSI